MSKKIIKNLFTFISILITLFFIPNDIQALEYEINSYDINVIVNENNTLQITEKIGVYFNTERHGIFRKIPLKNEITRLDGTKSKNRVKISNIEVSEYYTKYKENGYQVIKIGNENHTLKGQKNYTISYLYNLGKDTGKEYDELYFNLIGTEWDTSISNITFTIIMPKEFDKSKLGFSKGKLGTISTSGITFSVNNNIITGELNKTLSSGEALTVRLELPEGYFVGASTNYNPLAYIIVFVHIFCFIISFFIWNKYGKDNPLIESVEFYPPDNLNSLEIGFLYKGKVRDKEVISLLIYLANKGYLKITESKENLNDFSITLLKEYDGNDKNEQLFINELFKNSNSKKTVKSNELYISDLIRKIIPNMNDFGNTNKVFEDKNIKKTNFMAFMLFFVLTTVLIFPCFDNEDYTSLIILAFPTIILLFIYAIGIFADISIVTRIVLITIATYLSVAFFSMVPIAQVIMNDFVYLVSFSIGIICIIGITICIKLMPKRTKYGDYIIGRINGFKNFLEVVEKEKLEAMIMKNPNYFFDILPYTYVLEISDKWIKKFELIELQSPSWYDGKSDFNINTFSSFIDKTNNSAQKLVTYSSNSSSGESFSDDSLSGGGSGGGGGGSW